MNLPKGETRRDALRILGLAGLGIGAVGSLGGGCTQSISTEPPPPDSQFAAAHLREILEKTARRVLNVEQDVAAFFHLRTRQLFVCAGQDHFWHRRHAPGSVIKIVTAYALLRSGRQDRTYRCTGKHNDRAGITRNCWFHAGHGPMRMRTALAHSCNTWFLEQTQSLSSEEWLEALRQFCPNEGSGSWQQVHFQDVFPLHLSTTELLDVALGVSPLHQMSAASLLRLIALVASQGRVLPFASPRSGRKERPRQPPATTAIERRYLNPVVEGMQEAIRGGTLRRVFSTTDVIAKSGTAPKFTGTSTRGLVVGYFPVRNPAFGFVVIKNTGRGAADAGPPANALLAAVREKGARL